MKVVPPDGINNLEISADCFKLSVIPSHFRGCLLPPVRPWCASIDEALVRRRGALSLALGLNRASVMDAQRGVASRLYLTFLQGTLERKCRLDPVDLASLKVPCRALQL